MRKIMGYLLFGVEVLALCLPALANRGPMVFADTRAYYLGGRATLDKVSALFSHSDGAVDSAISKARGVRSAFYSLFTYLATNLGSVWFVVVIQATIVVLVLRLVFSLLCPMLPAWRGTLFITLVALLTSASWTTSFVMPDVFTAVMVLCIIVTILFWERLNSLQRCLLFIGIAVSMVMHLTNLPIALGILVAGMLLRLRWSDRSRYFMIGSALGLGVVALLGVSVIGFKQWTLTPQAPPFLLARSIEDGPGRMYLLEHCPQIGLAMCRHLDRLNVSTEVFIWKPEGVYSAVSPVEAAQLRAEDKRVFVAAAIEHPWMQARALVSNTLTQLISFPLIDYHIPSGVTYTATDMTFIPESTAAPPWQVKLSIIDYLVVIAGLGYGIVSWRTLDWAQREFFILILVMAVLEAFAGAMSEPAPRYEARVIWLIPMTAILFVYGNRRLS